MIVRDWRQADAGLLQACYERERRSWRDDLGWDTQWTWATIEHARVTWGLPGVLALDDHGEVRGWAFYMRDGATLHIGGLVASSADVTLQLLDAVLAAAPPTSACFIRDRAPDLFAVLQRGAFAPERFLYLSRPLTPADAVPGVQRLAVASDAWHPADAAAAACLFHEAYPRKAAQHFAGDGTIEDWTKYVVGVVGQGGCGQLDPDATRVIRRGDELTGIAMITGIAPETAHLAQLVVHPSHRGQGIASALLRDVLARSASSGKSAMTLLVSEQNRPARQVYEAAGFVQRGLFVAGRRVEQGVPQSVGEAPFVSPHAEYQY
jgi:ribosomal protein S18 acetylase RimI-like enzyme